MATSGPFLSHNALKAKSRYYKSELMTKLFGVSASAATGYDTAVSTNQVLGLSCVPDFSNLVGLGYGAKWANGSSVEGEEALRVYVRTKLPKSALSHRDFIPSHVNGLATDVIPIGDITPLRRSVQCGVSIGHPSVTAGTIACLVGKTNQNEHYLLSNNHVLANCDKASIGDPILQPGPLDGGTNPPIAELTDFEPIMDGGPKIMDAAIARVLDINSVVPEISDIGAVQQPPMPPAIYQSVRKCGRTTRHTIGIVLGVDEDFRIRYDSVYVNFEGQFAVHSFREPFSGLGDSGSLVVDAVSRRAVGLLFASGLDGIGIANDIAPVLDRFGVEII
jgi:hypothetical protein